MSQSSDSKHFIEDLNFWAPIMSTVQCSCNTVIGNSKSDPSQDLVLLPSLLSTELFWLWSLYLEHKNAASPDLTVLPTKQMLARNLQVLFARECL